VRGLFEEIQLISVCRHSGESRNPRDAKKIPAFAGMTDFD
jgi:hypothetical protein